MAGIIVYSLHPIAMAAVWVLTLVLVFVMRRRLHGGTAGVRLRMDLVRES